MKLISSLSSNYFSNHLRKKIHQTKRFLNLKQSTVRATIHDDHLNLFTDINSCSIFIKITQMIKYSCVNFFQICYKQNRSQEFYKTVIKISQFKIFSSDANFISLISRFSFKFVNKWYKKNEFDTNPKSFEFKSCLNFVNFLFKLVCFRYNDEYYEYDEDNFNYHDENQKIFRKLNHMVEICIKKLDDESKIFSNKFFYRVVEFLIRFSFWIYKKNYSNTTLIGKLNINFFGNLDNLMRHNVFKDSKSLKVKKIFIDYLINCRNFEEFKTLDLKSEFALFLKIVDMKNFDVTEFFTNCFINLDLNNKTMISQSIKIYSHEFLSFLKTISVKKIIQKYHKILQTVESKQKENLLKYYKLLKKILSYWIITMIENYFKYEDISDLLEFYTKNLINFNLKILSENDKINELDNLYNNSAGLNYMSFFRIKTKIIFVIKFNHNFAYNVIGIENLQNLSQKFRNIYFDFEDKQELEISKWWKQRVDSEKNMEDLLFEFQRELLKSESIHKLVKRIFSSNHKFLEFLSSYMSSNEKIENFSDEIVENLINYGYDTRNSYKIITKDFYSNENHKQIKNKKNSKTVTLRDLYDKQNIIHLVISSELANYPLENIPIFYKLPIVRTLSYSFINRINSNQNKFSEFNLCREDIYYLLNPSQDLINTEERLKPLLKDKMNFSGIIGKKPDKKQLWDKFIKSKFFLYSGHSNGSQYLDNKILRITQIDTICILMGCSSVKIENYMSRNNQPLDTLSYYQINKR
jgi:hypothetical protein